MTTALCVQIGHYNCTVFRLVTTTGCEDWCSMLAASTSCQRLMTRPCASGIYPTNATTRLCRPTPILLLRWVGIAAVQDLKVSNIGWLSSYSVCFCLSVEVIDITVLVWSLDCWNTGLPCSRLPVNSVIPWFDFDSLQKKSFIWHFLFWALTAKSRHWYLWHIPPVTKSRGLDCGWQ